MEPSQASNDNERVAEAGSSAAEAPSTSGPASYIITHSVSKRHNIGTIVRSATAFGVKEVRISTSGSPNSFLVGPVASLSSEKMFMAHDGNLAPTWGSTPAANPRGHLQVCLVGSRQFNTFGSHGSDAHVAFRHFDTLAKCVQVGPAAAGAAWVRVGGK